MTQEENHLDIEQKPELPVKFRDDLRQPAMQWGRCCVTGEWGPVIGIDLGDISIEAPLVDQGVIYDPVTKEVIFTKWRPARFEQQANFSLRGLEMLMNYMQNSSAPVPMITPELVYMWKVMYEDGTAQAQFQFDPIDCVEREQHSGSIDFSRISQLSVTPRHVDESVLPTYTFDQASGKFYRAGVEIDVEYDGVYPAGMEPYYARKVTHTWGSVIGNKLAREIQDAATTVLQLIGWRTPGEDPVKVESEGKCCVISIDDRGNWRAWKYNE